MTTEETIDQIAGVLENQGLPAIVHGRTVTTACHGDNLFMNLNITVPDKPWSVVFRIPRILKCPVQSVPQLLETMAKVNDHIGLGAFKFIFERSELTYWGTIPLEDGNLTDRQIGICVGVALMSVDEFYPEFVRACWGGSADHEELPDPFEGTFEITEVTAGTFSKN